MNRTEKADNLVWIMSLVVLIAAIWLGQAERGMAAENAPVYVESYKILEGSMNPGEEILMEVVLANTSSFVAADDVLLSYTSTNTAIYPVFQQTNQLFIGNMEVGERKVIQIPMQIAENITSEKADIAFGTKWIGRNDGILYSNVSTIAMPIAQASVLEINNISVASNSVVNAKTLVSVSLQNGGTKSLYDVILHVDGDVEESQKEQIIGELAAGDTKYLDAYVNFMNSGSQQVTFWFTYADEEGVEYTVEAGVFSVAVTERNNVNNSNAENQESQYGTESGQDNARMTLVVLGLIAVIILIGIAIGVMKRRR